MPYKRTWVKDLSIQELSKRLKGGENIYHDQDEGFIAIVDGLMLKWKNGKVVEINPTFRPQNLTFISSIRSSFNLKKGKSMRRKVETKLSSLSILGRWAIPIGEP